MGSAELIRSTTRIHVHDVYMGCWKRLDWIVAIRCKPLCSERRSVAVQSDHIGACLWGVLGTWLGGHPFDSTRVHLSRFIASTVRFILISICGADEPFGHLRACCVVRAKEQNFLLHSLRTFPRLSAIVVEG